MNRQPTLCPTGLLACFLVMGMACQPADESAPDKPPRQTPKSPSTPAAPSAPAAKLLAGQLVESSIGPDDSHRYAVELLPGQFATAVIDQRGADVVARVESPSGELLVEVDNIYGRRRPEVVAFVAQQPGAYVIRIEPLFGEAGTYSLTLPESPRPPTAREITLASALRERWLGSPCAGPEDLRLLASARDRFAGLEDRLREAESARLVGLCLKHLGVVSGAGEDAAGSLSRSLELFRSLKPPEPDVEAELLLQLGGSLELSGQLTRAETSCLEGLALAGQLGDTEKMATAFVNLAQLHRARGEFQLARDWALKAEQLEDRSISASIATTNVLGMIAFDTGDFDEALRRAQELEKLRPATADDPDSPAQGAALEARVWWKRGDLAAALRLVEEAELVADPKKPSAAADRADRLNLRAVLLAEQGRFAEALDDLERARVIYAQRGNEGELAMNTFNRGATLERSGRAEEGLVACQLALQAFERFGRRGNQASAWFCQARALVALSRLEAAEHAARQAVELSEDVRSRLLSPGLRSNFQLSKRLYYDLLVELLMRRANAGDLRANEQALATSDLARARLLLESLAEIREQLRASTTAESPLRRRRIRARAEELSTGGTVADDWAQVERDALALEEEIRRGNPAFAALTAPPPLDVARLQTEVLTADSELLFFHLAESRSFLWRIRPESLESFELPSSKAIEVEVRAVLEGLAGADDPRRLQAAEAALDRLSTQLLRPLAGRPLARRLLIAPDGLLTFLPFTLLKSSPEGAELIEHHEIVMVPSVAALLALVEMRGKRTPGRRTVAVIGDPVIEPNDSRLSAAGEWTTASYSQPAGRRAISVDSSVTYSSLAFARQEVQAILARVPAAQGLRISGLEANRDHLLSGVLRDFRIVHFATHGALDLESPLRSRIVLSQFDEAGRRLDRSLFLAHLYRLELSADLVVAGTCKSALASRGVAEGFTTFTRGFLYAGAASVVVSLWSVDDEATFVLMDRFYEHHLKGGLPAATALRQAQLDLRASARWSNPLYWAAFTVHGDPP